MGLNYREETKKQYQSRNDDSFTLEQLNTGALLRIADATEKMALNYGRLIEERDSLQRENRLYRLQIANSRLSSAALRGVITRLKRAKSQG